MVDSFWILISISHRKKSVGQSGFAPAPKPQQEVCRGTWRMLERSYTSNFWTKMAYGYLPLPIGYNPALWELFRRPDAGAPLTPSLMILVVAIT